MNDNTYERYILSIYRHKSLTKAAMALGISQPALSSGLNSIEKKLCIQIFDRRHSPIITTQEGEIYIDYLLKKKSLYNECQSKIADIRNDEKVFLTAGAPAVYMETILTDSVDVFHKNRKDSVVNLKEAPVHDLVQMTENQNMDLFISTTRNLPDSITLEEIGEERLYLCIPSCWDVNEKLKQYRITPGQEAGIFDFGILNKLNFIFMDEDQPLQKVLADFLKEYGVEAEHHFTSNQVALNVRLSAKGLGIVLASEYALKSIGMSDRLCIYNIPDKFSKRMLYVGYNSTHYLAKACREIINIMKERGC